MLYTRRYKRERCDSNQRMKRAPRYTRKNDIGNIHCCRIEKGSKWGKEMMKCSEENKNGIKDCYSSEKRQKYKSLTFISLLNGELTAVGMEGEDLPLVFLLSFLASNQTSWMKIEFLLATESYKTYFFFIVAYK